MVFIAVYNHTSKRYTIIIYSSYKNGKYLYIITLVSVMYSRVSRQFSDRPSGWVLAIMIAINS